MNLQSKHFQSRRGSSTQDQPRRAAAPYWARPPGASGPRAALPYGHVIGRAIGRGDHDRGMRPA
jgi:hypothetical protein